LDFEFGGMTNSDAVLVSGDLVLDGELLVNQLNDFDATNTYTLFTFGGALTDNGLAISPLSQDVDGVPATTALSIEVRLNPAGMGGTVVLVVPEPTGPALAMLTTLLLRRRRP
jgi:hypothetical protein